VGCIPICCLFYEKGIVLEVRVIAFLVDIKKTLYLLRLQSNRHQLIFLISSFVYPAYQDTILPHFLLGHNLEKRQMVISN
jgi:hypothetical protein